MKIYQRYDFSKNLDFERLKKQLNYHLSQLCEDESLTYDFYTLNFQLNILISLGEVNKNEFIINTTIYKIIKINNEIDSKESLSPMRDNKFNELNIFKKLYQDSSNPTLGFFISNNINEITNVITFIIISLFKINKLYIFS